MKNQSLLSTSAGAALMAGHAVPAPRTTPVYQCSADGARSAVGQPLAHPFEVAARVRAGAGTVRVRKPGDMATTELGDVRCG